MEYCGFNLDVKSDDFANFEEYVKQCDEEEKKENEKDKEEEKAKKEEKEKELEDL